MTTLKEEEPFAYVVATDCLSSTCSFCFAYEEGVLQCKGCHVVSYCNEKCQKSDWINHKSECKILKRHTMAGVSIPNTRMRLTMRILLKSEKALATKAFNGRTWNSLDDHITDIKVEAAAPFFNDVDHIMEELKPLKNFSRVEVAKAFGKVISNHLEIFESSFGIAGVGTGIYLGLSIHKHSCIPDAQLIFTGTKASLHSFDEITVYSPDVTFSQTNYPYWLPNRKENIKNNYFLECTCPICADENHIINRMGSSCFVSCCENAAGILDENSSAPYKCNKCGKASPFTVIDVILAQKRIDDHLMMVQTKTLFDINVSEKINKAMDIILASEKVLSQYNFHLVYFCKSFEMLALENAFHGIRSYAHEKGLKAVEYYLHETNIRRVVYLMESSVVNHTLNSLSIDDQAVLDAAERAFGKNHPVSVKFREHIREFSGFSPIERAKIVRDLGATRYG